MNQIKRAAGSGAAIPAAAAGLVLTRAGSSNRPARCRHHQS